MRSQNASAFTAPARVSGGSGCASFSFQVLYLASPRPGVRPVRSTPRMLMLYLIDGMPAAAQLRIRVCIDSMSRSRSGLCASMMAGCFSRSMWLDARNGGARQSMLMPFLSGQIAHALEFVHRGVEPAIGDLRVAADVAHAVAREVLQVRLIGGSALAAQLHQRGLCCRRCRLRSQSAAKRDSRSSRRSDKSSTIHAGQYIASAGFQVKNIIRPQNGIRLDFSVLE